MINKIGNNLSTSFGALKYNSNWTKETIQKEFSAPELRNLAKDTFDLIDKVSTKKNIDIVLESHVFSNGQRKIYASTMDNYVRYGNTCAANACGDATYESWDNLESNKKELENFRDQVMQVLEKKEPSVTLGLKNYDDVTFWHG